VIQSLPPSPLKQWADTQLTNPTKFLQGVHSFIRILLIITSACRKNEISLRAGALTFTMLLSLVPLLAMGTAVIKGLGGGDQLREVAYSAIDSVAKSLPLQPMNLEEREGSVHPSAPPTTSNLADHLRSMVDKLFTYVDRTNFTTLGTIGVIGMLIGVLLVLDNIEAAMNKIWHVENSRSISRKIADYIALIVLMPLSVNIVFAATAILKNQRLFEKIEVFLPIVWIQAVLFKVVPAIFLTLTLYIIYLFFPNTRVKTLPALIGAIFAGFLWIEVQNIYVTLQLGVSQYNAIYGSFATVPLFLLWLYCGWFFILLGAQIAFACQNHRTYPLLPVTSPAALSVRAAFAIMSSVHSSFKQEQPINLEKLLKDHPCYHPSLLAEMTATLISADMIHAIEESGHLLPKIPPEKLSHQRILSAILGPDFLSSKTGEKPERESSSSQKFDTPTMD
jgi:membrane protein